MSEYVKPRQFWFNFKIGPNESIIQNQIVYMIKNSKHDFHVIELEPTLQLMEEMGNKLSEVENYLHFRTDDLCGDDIKGDKKHTERFHQLTKSISYSLEKYRKFKEGLR